MTTLDAMLAPQDDPLCDSDDEIGLAPTGELEPEIAAVPRSGRPASPAAPVPRSGRPASPVPRSGRPISQNS